MSDAHCQLMTAPPRLGRAVMPRARLEQRWNEVCERTAVIVTAPQGFGKTTLLAQWRRNWLERGAFVAWASLDAQDDRARFVDMLFFALRAATGRESFSAAALQGQLQANRQLDALTALLAEVAQLATPTVVILDDAHRMPQVTLREVLAVGHGAAFPLRLQKIAEESHVHEQHHWRRASGPRPGQRRRPIRLRTAVPGDRSVPRGARGAPDPLCAGAA